jgi:hypothetical protein
MLRKLSYVVRVPAPPHPLRGGGVPAVLLLLLLMLLLLLLLVWILPSTLSHEANSVI